MYVYLDKLIWKKTVYKAIIPKQCKFIAGKRLEVKLKKLISEELWTDPPWRDDKVCVCTGTVHVCDPA